MTCPGGKSRMGRKGWMGKHSMRLPPVFPFQPLPPFQPVLPSQG
jgi:hypothetical protein